MERLRRKVSRRMVLLGLLAGAGVAAAWAVASRPEELVIEKLKDNLFIVTGNGGNTAAFIHESGVVLVDTKNPGTGQRLLDVVRTITDKPVTHIINTHAHSDHVGSNAFFPERAEIVTQEDTAARMTLMNHFRAPADRRGLRDRTFTDKFTVLSGDESIDLYHFGPAHTGGDAFIVFRALRVMHSGDVFLAGGPHVDASNGGSAQQFPQTLAKAVAGITGVETVIPGHGRVTTWEAFVEYAGAVRARAANR